MSVLSFEDSSEKRGLRSTFALVYVDLDEGIHKVKLKVAQNEKRKKKLHGFSYSKNMAFCIKHKPLTSEE